MRANLILSRQLHGDHQRNLLSTAELDAPSHVHLEPQPCMPRELRAESNRIAAPSRERGGFDTQALWLDASSIRQFGRPAPAHPWRVAA